MNRAADLLEQDIDVIAEVMTLEMGKTLKSARAEAAKCAKGMRFYAEHAEGFLADEPVEPSVVGASQAYGHYSAARGRSWRSCRGTSRSGRSMRFAAPALMAGNVGLLKHASNVPQMRALPRGRCSAGPASPPACFTTLLIGSGDVERVLRRPAGAGCDADRLRAGRAFGGRHLRRRGQEDRARAWRLRSLHRDAVRGHRASGRGRRDGPLPEQRPVLHRRQALHRPQRRLRRLRRRVRSPHGGAGRRRPDGRGDRPGPAGHGVRAATDVEELVDDARAKGAAVLCGGTRPDGPGWYYPATVVAELKTDMRMYAEEVFGPVAGLFRVASFDEAHRGRERDHVRPRLQRLDHRPGRAGSVRARTSTPAPCSSTA